MTTTQDEALERLRRLLGGPQLARLRDRLRARCAKGDAPDEFTLAGLATAERRALEVLLGRPLRGSSSMRVRQSELDAVISRAGLAEHLRGALELLDGPIRNLRAERNSRQQAWNDTLNTLTDARLCALVSDSANVALLKRLSAGDAASAGALLAQVGFVLERLPAQGLPLARLAAESLGDSHMLDVGRPVATLVLRTFAAVDPPLDPDERIRSRWARLGVTVNELSRPALLLNLVASDLSPGARIACAGAACGEPAFLSLRTLLRQPPQWDVGQRDVFVCENPTVIAIAADRLGAACAPLVCTDGMPATAQQTLLAQIVERGGRLRYHGDFDWPGLAVGNFVIRTFGALPWRFGAEDYRAARSIRSGRSLAGRRIEAAWDVHLSPAMADAGMVVHEEGVMDSLLADLKIAAT